MADNALDDLLSFDDNRSQAIKTNEITGNRFILHSLPKEFQDWHNVLYVMEKNASIDERAVSDAILNGYMWKAIFDGVEYGMMVFFTIFWSAVKMKLAYSAMTLIISLMVTIPIFIYAGYHFVFYAMIKAQVIGEVTKKAADATRGQFTATFWGTVFALTIAFLFFVYTSSTFLPIIAYGIYKWDQAFNNGIDSIFVDIEKFMIILHNGMVKLTLFESWINNIYTITALFLLLATITIASIDFVFYKKYERNVIKEIVKVNRKKYYPIEVAQKIMKEWKRDMFNFVKKKQANAARS